MFERFHWLASPKFFHAFAGRLIPWLWAASIALFAGGLYFGLFSSPRDYQQGESVRIMYVHVPAAWMSLFIYAVMAGAAALGLIFRVKLAHVVAAASAPIGASFTFIALVTGSLWGKPMWGTYWVWDARLTSELILLFLYFGYIGLRSSVEDRATADKASAILALVGVVNIPIIHYSVEWWYTLHQGPTVTKIDKPSIHPAMLRPLLLMAFAYMTYYGALMLSRARAEILDRQAGSAWARALLNGTEKG